METHILKVKMKSDLKGLVREISQLHFSALWRESAEKCALSHLTYTHTHRHTLYIHFCRVADSCFCPWVTTFLTSLRWCLSQNYFYCAFLVRTNSLSATPLYFTSNTLKLRWISTRSWGDRSYFICTVTRKFVYFLPTRCQIKSLVRNF